MPGTNGSVEERALSILKNAYGANASFRPGQLEAIVDAVAGRNSLVVQKTGWGKSLVYFIATKILREGGSGPSIIISPLLALMENQIESARVIGVEAVTINSDNAPEWDEILGKLDSVDAIIVSPERLGNDRFMENLSRVKKIRLLVVDEAHSISDWGHDFRPDYQRISRLIDGLPGNISILGTTATANNRVISDIRQQLGDKLSIVRGNLIRENLAIQVNPEQTREQRLAWIAQALTNHPILSSGQGIIYCLTHTDCEILADYLSQRSVNILPYYSGVGSSENHPNQDKDILSSFVDGRTRVLAATIKLGMGYDKSDIRFVIHFQPPQNLISYYQQIGRAGRDGQPAYAFLLHGSEDMSILDFFIRSAQAEPELLSRIVKATAPGAKRSALSSSFNVRKTKLDEALKFLLVHDYIYKDGPFYRANPGMTFDAEAERDKQQQLANARYAEHLALIDYMKSSSCYMSRIAQELDAPDARQSCGICANCKGSLILPVSPDQRTVLDATSYLGNRHISISPRKKWSTGGAIPKNLQMKPGWCLCADYYSETGQAVRKGKYELGEFSAALIDSSAQYLSDCVIKNGIDCVVPVPSLKRPNLVPVFAKKLAEALGLEFAPAVTRHGEPTEQKTLLNSVQQEMNIKESTRVEHPGPIRGKTVLLVDDMVDSRWTMTAIAAMLLAEDAKDVFPFALVRTGGAL